MAKLPVRLFVLLVLGNISICEDIFLPLNNAYQPVAVTKKLLQYAVIETVNLPYATIAECEQAAATEGLDAFVFDGSCTGYELVAPFHSGTTDSLVMFVREDKFAKEFAIINLDDYPYENMSTTYGSTPLRQYMMSSFIVPVPSNRFYIQRSFEGSGRFSEHFITAGNKHTFTSHDGAVDLRSCLTNSTDGVPIVVSFRLYSRNIGIGYFLNECGNTLQIPNQSQAPFSLIHSHEGLGCFDNPYEVPDECKVTFENAEGSEISVFCSFSDPKLEDGCPGYNMTVTGSSLQGDETETVNSCTSDPDFGFYGYDMLYITLLKHRSTPKSGFYCSFFIL